MPRSLPSFLVSALLLALAACATPGPDPSPAPTLAGSWQVSSAETTEYNSDFSVRARYGPAPVTPTTTYVFTAATLTTTVAGTPTTQYVYTQAGNVLTLTSTTGLPASPLTQTIALLTTAELALEEKRPASAGGTTVSTTHLVR